MNTDLLQMAAEDLTQARAVDPHVTDYLATHYGLTPEKLGSCLSKPIPHGLEEYELDLMFSPQFTPTRDDVARYIPIVEGRPLSQNELAAHLDVLDAMELTTYFCDGFLTFAMPVPKILAHRYLRLLHLTVVPDAKIEQELGRRGTPEDHAMLKAMLRERGWRRPGAEELLKDYLRILPDDRPLNRTRFAFLTEFVDAYRPKTLGHLLDQMERMVASYQHENDRYIFNDQLDTQQQEEKIGTSFGGKQRDFRLAMADAVRTDLAAALNALH